MSFHESMQTAQDQMLGRRLVQQIHSVTITEVKSSREEAWIEVFQEARNSDFLEDFGVLFPKILEIEAV